MALSQKTTVRDLLVAELQKRADQSVLIFMAGANFWEKHAKNFAIMSMAHSTGASGTGAPSTGASGTGALAPVLVAPVVSPAARKTDVSEK